MHRDLKPGNLLITDDDVVKIADFGLARGYGIPVTNYSHEVVTLWYRAPDVLLGSKDYMTTVDIWSIGCIFAEMITGKPLFTGINESDQLKKIFRIMGTPNTKTYPNLKNLPEWKPDNYEVCETQDLKKFVPTLDDNGFDLLSQMLIIDPDKRIDCEGALKHKYFDDIQDFIKDFYK